MCDLLTPNSLLRQPNFTNQVRFLFIISFFIINYHENQFYSKIRLIFIDKICISNNGDAWLFTKHFIKIFITLF